MKLIAVIDLPAEAPFHRASLEALRHAADASDVDAEIVVIRTPELTGNREQLGDGVLVGPGSPYDNPAAAQNAIRLARERGIPLVAT